MQAMSEQTAQVSPAHAGIDPGRHLAGRLHHGFPRACGDRPAEADFGAVLVAFPPRMRG